MNPPKLAIEEISEREWQATPERVREVIAGLVRRIEQLEQQQKELRAENERVREQLQQNSKNSSQAPSQDKVKGFKPKPSSEKKKKRGGQPGHEGHSRSLYAPDACQRIEEHLPETCRRCGKPLRGSDATPHRVQIVELPDIRPVVEEHRFHQLECNHCGAKTRARDEVILNHSGYGERLVASVSMLSGVYRQSHQMVKSLLKDVFGIKISVGSINHLRQEVSDALADPVISAQHYVQQQAQINIDETSFPQKNADGGNPQSKKGWLWVMVTPSVSYFEVSLSRSQAVAKQLLGECVSAIIGSDRYSAYNWLALEQRQVCWAHLKRDFTRIAQRSGVSAQLGAALLKEQKALFEQWHRVRDGTGSRAEFIAAVAPIRERVKAVLEEGAGYELEEIKNTPLAKTARTFQQLLKVEPALWTFVSTEGVEPTNNVAERAIRPAVLWRKTSFGSHSTAGSLFVSRILTAVTSLKAQNRSVLDFLSETVLAARNASHPPSLLPVSVAQPPE